MTSHRILIASYAAGGGVRASTAQLANGLSDLGHQVMIANPSLGPPLFEQLDSRILLRKLPRQVWPFTQALALRNFIREFCPTHLVTSQDQTIVPAAILRKSGGLPCRWIAKVHNNPLEHTRHANPLVRAVASTPSWTYKSADALIAVSRGLREMLVQRGLVAADKAVAIWNPIALDQPGYSEIEAPGKPFILSVGTMNQQKDHVTLLRTFALLADRYDGDLVILGDGPLRSKLERLAINLGIGDRVRMPGFGNPSALYRAADLFVFTSRWEGLGRVLIEAMGYGCRIVSTDCEFGPREILDGGRFGALCPVGNPKALADACVTALSSPAQTESLITRASEFSPIASVRRHVGLFTDLMKDPKAAGDHGFGTK